MYKLWMGATLALGLALGACKDEGAGGVTGVTGPQTDTAAVAGPGAAAAVAGPAAAAAGVGSVGATNEPKPGETYISLKLSGGHLKEPLLFQGTIDQSPTLFDTSTKILATRVGLKASNGDAVLKQFIVGLDTVVSGPFDAEGRALDIVFDFPDLSTSYSLRPIGGSGGVDLDRGNNDRATVKVHFDAAPTQINSKHMRFRLEGVIDSRVRE